MTETLFFRDGEYVRGGVSLPPGSPAFTAGFSLFETIRVDSGGRGFRIEDHALRMRSSAQALGLSGAPGPDAIRTAAAVLAMENRIGCGRLRVILSLLEPGRTSLVMHLSPFTPLSRETRMKGIKGILMPFRRSRLSPLAGHKTANHLEAALARASLKQDEEGVVLNDAGRVCEGLYSNVFVVNGSHVSTPALSEGCLPGVTRAAVLSIAGSLGMNAGECEMRVPDMADAEGAFVSNALGGVTPLSSFDGREYAGGPCGAVISLMDALDRAAGRDGVNIQ